MAESNLFIEHRIVGISAHFGLPLVRNRRDPPNVR
jgi:hypothetical protein